MRYLFLNLLLLFVLFTANAQPPCAGPGRTSGTAQAVCGRLTFTENDVSNCTGQGNLPNPTAGCGDIVTTDNSRWYKFHCYVGGTLGFLINPNSAADDYDWEVMDITGHVPNDVYTMELRVSLNLSGQTGPTGCTATGSLDVHCGGGPAGSQFNQLMNLQTGHDYIMMVNNYSASNLPYTINFSGTAQLSLNVPPTITNVSMVPCDPSKLRVTFSEDILCTTITNSGSEFGATIAGQVVTGITSDCSLPGAYGATSLIINLQTPIPTGTYQLTVGPGSDLDIFDNVCELEMLPASIPFTITAPTPPVIQSYGYDECHRNRLVVNFDKPVACASLTATGSEFNIVPAGPVITGIISNCGTNNYTSQVVLLLQNNMPTLPFSVLIFNGSDGNTLSDTCSSFIPQGYGTVFTPPPLPPKPRFNAVQVDYCDPTFVKVHFDHPILCSSIIPDGSQFTLAVPPPVNIISAAADPASCVQGYTHWLLLGFSGPINTAGYYRVVARNIGAPVNDTCDMAQAAFDTISFYTPGKLSPNFNSQVKWGCAKDTIVLSHAGGNDASSWIWNFSDGTSATGQNVSHTFPVTTQTATVQLIVSNGTCIDSLTQTFVLGNYFKAGFSNNPADSFCVNTPVIFTDTSRGNISNYLWDFGDLQQFNGQNPPPHIYPVSNNYTIKLVVTDIYGCKDTASSARYVTPAPFIDFTGLKPQYCTGNQVVLRRKIGPYITSYVWDNGDGKTFTNEVDVNFSYATQGVYTITLSGVDRYCGTATVSKTVPVYAVPLVKLPADTVLCQNDQILIGVAATANYTYLWSTGESTSQILTNIFTRDYTLTADNMGCKAYDAMHVKVLTACVIKMPGAFTPNRDGLNDLLMATNADMAKNFSLKIFNRSGQLVFSTNNPLDGWDGRFKGNPQETGTYVWMLSYIDPWNGKAVKEKGTSILLR